MPLVPWSRVSIFDNDDRIMKVKEGNRREQGWFCIMTQYLCGDFAVGFEVVRASGPKQA